MKKQRFFLNFFTNGKLTWASIGREGWEAAISKYLRVQSEKNWRSEEHVFGQEQNVRKRLEVAIGKGLLGGEFFG